MAGSAKDLYLRLNEHLSGLLVIFNILVTLKINRQGKFIFDKFSLARLRGRSKKIKYPNGVGIYRLDNNLIKSLSYLSDLAKYLNVSKVTVSKYINKGLV